MANPVFSPFVMDGLSRRGRIRPTPMVAMPRRVHVVEVPYEKPNGLHGYHKKVNVMPNEVVGKMAPRKPRISVGNGELLGKALTPDGSFTKSVAMFPSRATKRVYYSAEDDSQVYMAGGSGEDNMGMKMPKQQRTFRVIRQGPPKMYGDVQGSSHHVDVEEEVVATEVDESDEMRIDVLHGEEVEGVCRMQAPEHSMEGEHDEGGPMDMIAASSKARNVPIIKQLSGENQYLKDQLDAALYKNKQLEMLLLDRNVHIKQLLKDNLQLGCKIRRFIAEIGEDAADEILNPKPKTTARRNYQGMGM